MTTVKAQLNSLLLNILLRDFTHYEDTTSSPMIHATSCDPITCEIEPLPQLCLADISTIRSQQDCRVRDCAIMALGWAFYIEGLFTLWSVLVMAIFFDIKSRREERWLLEKYPEYAVYGKKNTPTGFSHLLALFLFP